MTSSDHTDHLPNLPTVPAPQLHTVENTTPYPHLAFDKMGKGRLFYDVVVCKATFALSTGQLHPAEKMQTIQLADHYWDETAAELSSLQIAGDVLLTKPSTDILITGTAYTFNKVPKTNWLAGLRVSRQDFTIAEHAMQLHGPRYWQHKTLRGWSISAALPTSSVALRHELAYGGHYRLNKLKSDANENTDVPNVFTGNPSGCGYLDTSNLDKSMSYTAPQIETPTMPVVTMGADYPLASSAPVARFWNNRTRHGGTYDDLWHQQFQSSAIPDYPADFDERYFQCAHPNLITKDYLQGDERLYLVGLVPEAEVLVCDLPDVRLHAALTTADGRQGQRAMVLDTLQLDLDSRSVTLTWRLTLDQRLCVERVRLEQTTTQAANLGMTQLRTQQERPT